LTAIVIDASACLAWVLPSQRTGAAMAFLKRISDETFLAPFIFQWETQNVLLRLRRTQMLTETEYVEATVALTDYHIALGEPFSADRLEPLARRERLSLFDTAYLALAIEEGVSLASRDRDLLAAAEHIGIETWDLR